MCLSIRCGVEAFRILIVCVLGIIITLIISFVDFYPLLVREVWIANPIHIFQGLIPGLGPCDGNQCTDFQTQDSYYYTYGSFVPFFHFASFDHNCGLFLFPKELLYKYNTINIIMQVLIIFLLHFLTFAYIFLIFLFLLLFYFLELCLQNRDLITFC